MHQAADYERLAERLDAQGIDVEEVKDRLKAQHIETPSWGYGNSGTRFKVYSWPGAARNIQEKLADAGYVQRLTGVAPTVALHIPWDKVDDWEGLAQFAAEQGVGIGAINPNVFQEEQYRLGSITNPSATVREEAVAHMAECCDIMTLTGSDLLSLWFADGTNYSGQDSMSVRNRRMEAALADASPLRPERLEGVEQWPGIGEHVAGEGVRLPRRQVRGGADDVPEADRLVVEQQHRLPEVVERPAHVAVVVHDRLGRYAAGVTAETFVDYERDMRWALDQFRQPVLSFYNQTFSFRDFIRAHPDLHPRLVDALVGNVFADLGPLFEALQEFSARTSRPQVAQPAASRS